MPQNNQVLEKRELSDEERQSRKAERENAKQNAFSFGKYMEMFKDNLAEVDYTKCTRCGICVEQCPTGCLRKVHFPDLPEDYNYKDYK